MIASTVTVAAGAKVTTSGAGPYNTLGSANNTGGGTFGGPGGRLPCTPSLCTWLCVSQSV